MAYIQIPAFSKINTLDNDTEFVIVVDGVEYLVTFKTLSEKFGNSPELLQDINAEIEALRNIVDAFPSENPAAPIALKISDTPIIDGLYKPTEAGTYPDAGGLEYDPTEGITYFIRTQGVWVKDVTPINFTPTGVVEEGNTQAVSGGEVFDAINGITKITPINLSTPLPEQNGIFQPTEIGIYENFGGLELTEEELESNVVYFYYLDGIFSKQTKGVLTVDEIDSESTNAVNGKAVFDFTNKTVNNINDLRLFNGKEGQIITLLGYYTAGDKEPLNYKWTSTQGVDDGGSVINTESGSWVAVFGNEIKFKDFGCKDSLTYNNTIHISKLISFINNSKSNVDSAYSLFVDRGYYLVDADVIKLTSNVTIKGLGYSSIIACNDIKTISSSGVEILGYNCVIDSIQVRGFNVGVSWDTQPYANLRNCKVSYNRIGLKINEPFISLVFNNLITFNKIGIAVSGQSYETIIDSNVIDDNISYENGGGIGVYLEGTIGVKLCNNTIEGNRNFLNKNGCGVFVKGLGTSFIIEKNWFENNQEGGISDYSCDIFISSRVENSFQTGLMNALLLPEYISNTDTYGSICIRDNFFYETIKGVVISNIYDFIIDNNVFTGRLGWFNKPIFLNFENPMFFFNKNLKINNLIIQNTGSNSSEVNAEMLSGINSSGIFGNFPEHEDGAIYDPKIYLDNKDISIFYTNTKYLIDNLNLTYDSNFYITSGNISVTRNKTLNGNKGFKSNAVNYDLVCFNNNFLIGKAFKYLVILSDKNNQVSFYINGNPSPFTTSNETSTLNILKINSDELTEYNIQLISMNTNVFGYMLITENQYNQYMKGCKYLNISDWNTESVIPLENLPYPTNWLPNTNEFVLNSNNSNNILSGVYKNGNWYYNEHL